MVLRRITEEEWQAIERARGALPDRAKVKRSITPEEWAAIRKARALEALSDAQTPDADRVGRHRRSA